MQFQIVSNSLRLHYSETLFSYFPAVSNIVRLHSLETLPLVVIFQVLLIWPFGYCVLLFDQCFKQSRTHDVV